MAVVGGQRVDLAAVGVERDGEVLAVLDPEVPVEAALEVGGLLLEPVGEGRVLPDLPGQPGAAHLGVVGVALQLAGRPREAGQVAVAVGDRVPGVLPALVLQPGLLVAALVGDVAVALRSAYSSIQFEGGPRRVLEVPHERGVAGPALVLVEQHHEQRRGVGGAVVRRVRPLLEGGQLAVAHLVQDAAGILVAEVVDPRALPLGQRRQRGRRELGGERQRLQAGEDAVPAEHRHEPRQAGRRQARGRAWSAWRTAAPPGRPGSAGRSCSSGSQSHSRRGARSQPLLAGRWPCPGGPGAGRAIRIGPWRRFGRAASAAPTGHHVELGLPLAVRPGS